MTLDPTPDPKNDRPATPHDGALDPVRQRDQLLKKLNCLIAVLEAAIAKVRRNQHSSQTDPDRLERIRANLENTLAICHRARVTLERRGTLPPNLPPEVSEAVGAQAQPPSSAPPRRRAVRDEPRMTYRDYVELSSFDEFKKFRELPPISLTDIAGCDLDSLTDRLNGT